MGGAEPGLSSGNNTLTYRLHYPGDVRAEGFWASFFSVSIPCMGREEREPTQQTAGELHRASTCRLQRIPRSLSPSMLTFKVNKKHLQQWRLLQRVTTGQNAEHPQMMYLQYNPLHPGLGEHCGEGKERLCKGSARTSAVRCCLLGQVQMGKVKQVVQSLTFFN